MEDEFQKRLKGILTIEFLQDWEDAVRGNFKKANQLVVNETPLKGVRQRYSEGVLRFQMTEQAFCEVAEAHGFEEIDSSYCPAEDARIYQPLYRKEIDGKGVIFGLASMSDVREVPKKNKTRSVMVALNYPFENDLFSDGSAPKAGDIFVVLLTCADRSSRGHAKELAIGAISSRYSHFEYYEEITDFLGGQMSDHIASEAEMSDTCGDSKGRVKLKSNIVKFVPRGAKTPPEDDSEADE